MHGRHVGNWETQRKTIRPASEGGPYTGGEIHWETRRTELKSGGELPHSRNGKTGGSL
jgi:hypothetical protein